jgi:hypothetical protein
MLQNQVGLADGTTLFLFVFYEHAGKAPLIDLLWFLVTF